MRRLFQIESVKEVRLWSRYLSNTYELLDMKAASLQDAGLYRDQVESLAVPLCVCLWLGVSVGKQAGGKLREHWSILTSGRGFDCLFTTKSTSVTLAPSCQMKPSIGNIGCWPNQKGYG